MAGVDDPVASPMSLVQDYLRGKGLQPTSDNVRRTLEQAARDPEFMPALRTQEPPTDTRPPSQRTKSAAADIERQPTVDPNQPGAEGNAAINYPPGFRPGGSPDTSAQPAPDVGNVGQAILGMAPALALGTGGTALWALNRPNSVPAPGASVPPPVDPGAPMTPRYNPEAVDPLQAPDPRAWNAESAVPDLGVPRQVDPLQTAINRAVEPSAVGPSSPIAPMSPAAPGPGPDQTYLGNARPETSTTLDPQPIPLTRRKVTVEEVPHPSAGVRPPVRTPYVPRLQLR